MYRTFLPLITAFVFAVAAFAAFNAWRRRTANQEASFERPLEALEFFGELLAQAKCHYVATTYAANHLERISAFGLGARGIAQVLVFHEGLLLVRNGETPIAIAIDQVCEVATDSTTIDKSVERDGLIRIDWLQSTTLLSTFIRVVDASERQSILGTLNNRSQRKATI